MRLKDRFLSFLRPALKSPLMISVCSESDSLAMFSASIFVRFSTKIQSVAPREIASIPKAPLPAKTSKILAAFTRGPMMLKIVSLTILLVGLVPVLETLSRRPLLSPPTILIFLSKNIVICTFLVAENRLIYATFYTEANSLFYYCWRYENQKFTILNTCRCLSE